MAIPIPRNKLSSMGSSKKRPTSGEHIYIMP